MHTLDGVALDRWITGNYGEDQFDDEEFDEVEAGCPRCGRGLDGHDLVQREDPATGADYEDYACAAFDEDGCPFTDADECALAAERSVAGKSNTIPGCALHRADDERENR